MASNSSTLDSWYPQPAGRFSPPLTSHVPKHNPVPPAKLHSKDVEFYLKQFYLKHNPAKVSEAPEIAKLYHHSLHKLEEDLLRKYGTNLGLTTSGTHKNRTHPVSHVSYVDHPDTPRPQTRPGSLTSQGSQGSRGSTSRPSVQSDRRSSEVNVSKRYRQDMPASHQPQLSILVPYQMKGSVKRAAAAIAVSPYPLMDIKQRPSQRVRCQAMEAPPVYMQAGWIY